MAKLTCKCGALLSTSEVPNDVQFWVYTDKEWDGIMTPDTIETWKFPPPANEVWRCPMCKRIYVFKGGYGKAVAIYKLEE